MEATLGLPRLRDSSNRPGLPTPPPEDAFEPLPPLRVLAAEDNPVNQLVLRTLLEQVGIEPIVADGQDAVDACMAAEWDLILMDVQMPVMDGVSASRAIRDAEARLGRSRTPIVALTANVMAHQVQTYTAAGIDAVVAKPIDPARLLEAMQACLDAPLRVVRTRD